MRATQPAAPRFRPLQRLTAAASRNPGLISCALYALGIASLVLLPLAGKAIYHDENALLVGHSESVIRSAAAIDSDTWFDLPRFEMPPLM
jgi:hypothetical protein